MHCGKGSEESVACEITCLESVNCLSLCLNFQSKSDQPESSLGTLLRLLPFPHIWQSLGSHQIWRCGTKGSVPLSLSIAQIQRMCRGRWQQSPRTCLAPEAEAGSTFWLPRRRHTRVSAIWHQREHSKPLDLTTGAVALITWAPPPLTVAAHPPDFWRSV